MGADTEIIAKGSALLEKTILIYDIWNAIVAQSNES